MSEVSVAPGVGEAAPIALPVSTPANTSPLSSREAADALIKRRLDAAKSPVKPAEDSASEGAAAEPDQESASPEADAAPPAEEAPGEDVGEPEPEAEKLPPIEAPRSWTKDEQERFKTYPRELQAYLSEREQERDRDLRRRQNEAADARKAVDAEREQAVNARQQYETALPALLATLQQTQAGEFSDIKSMEDVNRLSKDDPFRYLQWRAKQDEIAAVNAEIGKVQERQKTEHLERWSQFAKRQDELFVEKNPELKEKETAQKYEKLAVGVLVNLGFTEQELNPLWTGQTSLSLRDHRVQSLILNAVKSAEAKKTVEKAVAKTLPPVQRPGTAQPRGAAQVEQIQKLSRNLTESGSLRDAVALRRARLAANARGAPKG